MLLIDKFRFSSFVLPLMILCTLTEDVWSRARMIEPPMRSSYWREGVTDAPVNYLDELLHCGGFEYQWSQAKGRCGACGDAFGGYHENEYPGKYSQFPPQRKYMPGSEINVTVYITANFLGYFLFRLCPFRDGPHLSDLAECFTSHDPLIIEETQTTQYYPGSRGGYHDLHLLIPGNVSCAHCILQWTYVTGYREKAAGQCESCLGCGPQEHYVNCADVQILQEGDTSDGEMAGSSLDQGSYQSTTMAQGPMTGNAKTTPRTGVATATTQTSFSGSEPSSTDPARCTPLADIVTCEAQGIQRLIPGMGTWCLRTCQSGQCRPDFCSCYCKYPSYKIYIDPTAFDLVSTVKYSQLLPASLALSSTSSKTLCYKTTSLWSRTPGLNGWCAFNCPSEWCGDMCSLQVCP